MNTHQYVQAIKEKTGITSDYGVAKLLGASRQAASDWSLGKNQFSPLHCFKVAEILGLDPARVVADVERERAEKAGKVEAATAWRTWLERVGGVAAALLVGLISSAPTPAEARMNAGLDGADAVRYVNSHTHQFVPLLVEHRGKEVTLSRSRRTTVKLLNYINPGFAPNRCILGSSELLR